MRKMISVMASILRDEQGNELIEYSLLIGLIIVAAFMVMGDVGVKVLANWSSLNNLL